MLWTGTCQSSLPALSNSEWWGWGVEGCGEREEMTRGEGGREDQKEGVVGRGGRGEREGGREGKEWRRGE